MTRFRSLIVCVVAVAVVGCDKEATFTEPIGALAAATWVNAVPDTGMLNVRVIDIPSNAGLLNATFRSSLIYPQGIEAGPRRIKAFITSSNPDTAKMFLVDTTFTFVEDERYSFYVAGYARSTASPRAQALIAPATPPVLGAGQFAIRVINLAPSLAGAASGVGPVADTTVASEAWIKPINQAATGPREISIAVPYLGVSSYVVLDTGRYQLALTEAGTGAAPYVAAPVLPGTRGTATVDAIAGSNVAGTVLTAVLVPRSVVGSRAPQGGRAASGLRSTDTSLAEATRRVYRTGDTVTVQSGSVSILVNRGTGVADSTVSGTGTRATTGVARGDVVLVSGATQPEYNGWHAVMAVADSLSCVPADAGDTATRCNAANAIATTRFRFRYRIAGAPVSPATGAPAYRIYAPLTSTDFTTPYVLFVVDQRPPNTTP